MSIYAIETDRLTKRYDEVLAVQSVDLRVKQGEIYGFLGLNGAGKTNTIRALLGMVRQSERRVRILGQEIDRGGRGPWEQVGWYRYLIILIASLIGIAMTCNGWRNAGQTR